MADLIEPPGDERVEELQIFTSLRYDPKLTQVKDMPLTAVGWNSCNASPFYMLDYHRDRMLKAASHFGWTKAVETIEGDKGLSTLESFLTENMREKNQPWRMKVTLSKEGELGLLQFQCTPTSLANLFPTSLLSICDPTDQGRLGTLELNPQYQVHLDLYRPPYSHTVRSEYTHFKTTKRLMYDGARERARLGPSELAEVLLVNESGSIMEGSLTTPYFLREARWVTPPVSAQFSTEIGSGGQDGTTRRWALERHLAVEEEVKADTLKPGQEVWLSNGVRGFVYGRLS